MSQTNQAREEEIAYKINSALPQSYQKEILTEGLRALALREKRGLKARKILLVGGAGYIGTMVTKHLLSCGYDVASTDLLLYGNNSTVTPFLDNPHYNFIYGDLCDAKVLDKALVGVSDVVILAGLVGDPITKKYPEASAKINDAGILNLIKHLNGKGLNKVVFISTCSNYGLITGDNIASETYELNPLSLYAKSKVEAEKLILSLKGHADFSPTILRFATAYGLAPRMRFDLTVNEFTRDMYLNKDLVVFDADTWRPYCHVNDFASLIQRVLEAPEKRVAFEVFNAGGDKNNCTKRMIVEKIKAVLPQAPVSYKEHGTDPRNYRVDFKKVRETLFFEPKYSVDDGVKEIVAALKEHLFDRVEANKGFYGNYVIEY